MKLNKYSMLLVVIFLGYNATTQTALSVASYQATIEGATYEYTLGEMTAVTTDRNTSLVITQGFHQPNLSKEIPTGNPNAGIDDPSLIQVYPNPAQNIINIACSDGKEGIIEATLFDAMGKVIERKTLKQTLSNNTFSIDLRGIAIGTYYLMLNKSIALGRASTYSFKIQKK